ncbi:hypothetical protein [Anabaena sp. PCC 7108]|uniref:hypothetical protein n=1 Tax=Anabaena sp. PCC 7108 TaxID=163908 RepID=UPI000345422B|nr:hypothetical protein [Anabaena sp. PCC 7108]
MTLTVQELKLKLESFGNGATIQVEDTDGISCQITKVKEVGGNAILVIEPDESDEDDE